MLFSIEVANDKLLENDVTNVNKQRKKSRRCKSVSQFTKLYGSCDVIKMTNHERGEPITAQADDGPTHLALSVLDSGGCQGHHILQLRQLRVCGPTKVAFSTLLQLPQLHLQLERLAGGHVHLDR